MWTSEFEDSLVYRLRWGVWKSGMSRPLPQQAEEKVTVLWLRKMVRQAGEKKLKLLYDSVPLHEHKNEGGPHYAAFRKYLLVEMLWSGSHGWTGLLCGQTQLNCLLIPCSHWKQQSTVNISPSEPRSRADGNPCCWPKEKRKTLEQKEIESHTTSQYSFYGI